MEEIEKTGRHGCGCIGTMEEIEKTGRHGCGCIGHYSYRAASGVRIANSEKRWWTWCDEHQPFAEDLDNAIVAVKRDIDALKRKSELLQTAHTHTQ